MFSPTVYMDKKNLPKFIYAYYIFFLHFWREIFIFYILFHILWYTQEAICEKKKKKKSIYVQWHAKVWEPLVESVKMWIILTK